MQSQLVPLIIGISVVSLVVAGWLARWVLAKDTGTTEMQEISDAIKEGAEAFLRRQNRTIIVLATAPRRAHLRPLRLRARPPRVRPGRLATRDWPSGSTLSFVLGAACSVIAGYVGMWVSIRTNIRTASAARTLA